MDPITLFRMAVESITAHKLRSALVTLGILIGVGAVLINAGMVQGFQGYFEQQMKILGSNFVTIRPATAVGLAFGQLSQDEYLAPYLYDSVRRLPYVEDATASRTSYGKVYFMGEEEDVIVYGVEPGYLEARNREMVAGEDIVQQDAFNAVVAGDLLQSSSRRLALQSKFQLVVTVNRKPVTQEFRVKGITEVLENPIGISSVYVPVRTLNEMLNTEGYSEITLFAADTAHIDVVKAEATAMLDRLLKVEPDRAPPTPGEGEDMFFGLGPNVALGEEKYSITTQQDVLDVADQIIGMIQMALVSIAGISLLVGGIGIANVMLVTVSERTREIGVMKAVGAKNRNILIAFLFEAGVIGLFGGFLGLIFSMMSIFTMVPVLYDVPGALSPVWIGIALGISLVISLVSGLYPAIRASRMDPVEALRSE